MSQISSLLWFRGIVRGPLENPMLKKEGTAPPIAVLGNLLLLFVECGAMV